MTELKYGGSDVKIMYGDQEIGGAAKLEPGTILYIGSKGLDNSVPISKAHLFSTTEDWSNVNGISITVGNDVFTIDYGSINVPSDDFKNLDTEKEYTYSSNVKVTVSISIVDGEYRLNARSSFYAKYRLLVKAI